MHVHIQNLINIIKIGDPVEVKIAQKEVAKFWNDFYIPNRVAGRAAFGSFLEELNNFEKIKDAEHKAYFINTLKWSLWAIGEENFEIWARFLLTHIQDPAGKIRQAVIHATDYLIIDITLDDKYPGFEHVKLSKEQLGALITRNKDHFGSFVLAIEDLIEHYYEPRFNKYKYVSSLPSGVYKSLNILITSGLLRSKYYEDIYDDFLKRMHARSVIRAYSER